ncbi:Arabinose operon regulatory protein [compost metagenome]
MRTAWSEEAGAASEHEADPHEDEKRNRLKHWYRQGRSLLEFQNHSSLDNLTVNIRWLKEWCLHEGHPYQYLFEHTVIWLVTEGSAIITLGRIPYRVKAGDIVCIPSRTYQTWEEIGRDSPFCYLSFACEAKVGVFDFIRLYRFPVVESTVQPSRFQSLVESWRRLADTYKKFLEPFSGSINTEDEYMNGGSPLPPVTLDTGQTLNYLQVRTEGLSWMLELFKALAHQLPERPAAYDNRVFELCDMIATRLSEPLTLEELAETVSLGKEQLRALFKAALGMPPMKYVQRVRMQRAQELLLLTPLPVKEIAAMVGFENQHHFSRAFQHHNRVSPQQYRGQQKNKREA